MKKISQTIKTNVTMKKSIISCMVVGMTLISTTSFGKTNCQPRMDEPRHEVVVNHNQDKHHGKEVRIEPMHKHQNPVPQPEPRPLNHRSSSDLTTGVVVGTVVGTVISSLIH